MLRWIAALGITYSAAGCAEPGLLFLTYPEPTGHRAMVLALEADSGRQLMAIDLELGPFAIQLPGELQPGEDWRAHALLFEDDLDALKLAAGPLVESPAAEVYPILLRPELILALSSEDEAANRWQPVAEPPPEFTPLRVKNDDPFGFCPDIETRQIGLPGERGGIRILWPISPEQILVLATTIPEDNPAAEEQGAYLVTVRDGEFVVEELALPREPALRSGSIDDTGNLWAAAKGGQLVQVTLDQGNLLVVPVGPEPVPPLPEPFWLHVDQDAVLMMGIDGVVRGGARTSSSGVVWLSEALHEFPDGLDVGRASGALLDRGGGQIWLGKGTSRTILRLRHDRGVFAEPEFDDRLEDSAAIGISALGEVDGLGVLAGMTDGEISRYDLGRDAWSSLGGSGFTQVLSVIKPTDRGFLMAGGTGLFNYYVTGEGFCPLEERGYKGLRAPAALRFGHALAGGYLMGGATLFGSTAALTWLRAK